MMNLALRIGITLGICVLMLSTDSAHAETEVSCAKAKILSSSESCKNLRVAFDLSACGEKPGKTVSDPKISCSGNKATATVEYDGESYSARLRKRDGWGEATWDIIGSVKKESTQHAALPNAASPNKEEATESSKPADSEQSRSVAQSPSQTPASQSAITFSGLFDVYYSYNANRPLVPNSIASTSVTTASVPNGNNNLRYYDVYHNQIALSLAELTVKKAGSEASFLVDFDFGGFADQNVAVASPSTAPTSQVIDEVSKHVGQAIVTYTPSWAPGLVLDAGKMPTHVGYEVMKSRDNWQYSRSTTFGFGGPFWHTGLHIGYSVVPDKFIPSVYVYNGWNSIYDNNSSKTLGAQLKFVPFENLSIIYNFINGPEQFANNANRKMINEANITFSVTPAISFALELLMGQEKNVVVGAETVNAAWRAMTVHSKLQFGSRYYLSPRYEIYRDTHGYTVGGPAQTIHGYTLTNGLVLAQGLETRLEFRYDHSSHDQRFTKHDGFSKTQFTTTVALMYTL